MTERFGLDVPPHARRPVAWFALGGLRRIAREQLWSMNLLRNLDRRETFTGRLELIDLRHLADADGGFWLDFVADTGEGGNATTAVAQAVLQPALAAAGAAAPLPEARLMILGGDLAYPGASPETYQARLVEMFDLAQPEGWRADRKIVAAIPQNHDWLDSASTFCRTFVHPERSGLLDALAPQSRTYFALALPHGWYALGFDFALTGDLDRLQFEAFDAMLQDGRIPRGAQLVLIYPEPFWTRPWHAEWRAAYPRRYQRLESRLLQHGCSIRLRLAGDLHHYARDRLAAAPPQQASSDLITCGSGGAFGHGTHANEVAWTKMMHIGIEEQAAQAELRHRVLLYRAAPGAALAPGLPFDALAAAPPRYPAPEATRRAAWGNTAALLGWHRGGVIAGNLSFALFVGALLLAGAALPGAWRALPMAAMLVASLMLATDNDPWRADATDRVAGVVLGALHALAALALGHVVAPGGPALWILAVPAAVVGAALLNGSFLAVWGGVFGRIITNAASAMADEDHKGFLRICLRPQGAEAWMLGCDRVPRRWVRTGAQPAFRPEGPAPAWRVVDHFEMPAPPGG